MWTDRVGIIPYYTFLPMEDRIFNPASITHDIDQVAIRYIRMMVAHVTAGIILYRDYLYVNLYQMPILYVEIDI